MFRKVDFPQPDDPTIEVILFLDIEKLRFSNINNSFSFNK
jgi:hypothetical protein